MAKYTLKSTAASSILLATSAINSALAEPDLALDFEYVRVGQKRADVLKALGPPTGETKSKTLGLQHRRLVWVVGDKRYVVHFAVDRVWRVQRCDSAILECGR